jgi:hypothetical protein
MRGRIAVWEDSSFELSIEAVRRSEIEVKDFLNLLRRETGRIL